MTPPDDRRAAPPSPGSRPAARGAGAGPPAREEPTEDDRSILALLLKHQRRAWRRGERPRAEAYLAEQPALAGDPSAALDLIYQEIVLREEAGEVPRLEEYLARFPALEADLRLQFEVEEALRHGGLDDGRELTPTWGGPPSGDPAPLPDVAGYEILEEIGRGGMGVVYRARQLRLNRIVALKTILAGDHASPESSVRFLAEAEAVARLEHPNIVRIHALGEHRGRPYFEMEYVAGGNLAALMNGTPWPPREAARLVESLARAIHEAHRLGIVHRDLKPANVLMADAGTPKIADFGLAKWLDVETGLTSSHWIVGSPTYMAPEQAGGGGPIGPAADVYSLGALLYELLTGRPPFRAPTVLETLEQVKSAEPVSPSRLRPDLTRDLVTICLKCLEKQPGRRYAGADLLAEDLRRFVAGETVLARPAGRAERFVRWCRREPALALLALALVAGLVGSTTQLWRAERHLAEARRQRRLAEENARRQAEANAALVAAGARERRAQAHSAERFDMALESLRGVEGMACDATLLRRPDLEPLRAALLETALGFYRRLQASLEAEEDPSPEARSQLSAAYARVANISWELGLRAEALATHRSALALVERMAAERPDSVEVQEALAACHTRIGFTLRTTGFPVEAIEAYSRGREIQERLARRMPEEPRLREVLSWTLSNLGVLELELGRPARAVPIHREAISLHEALVRKRPGPARYRSDLAWARRYLAQALAALDRPDEAIGLLEAAVSALEEIDAGPEGGVEDRWRLARCLDEIGRILTLNLGRPAEADAYLARSAGLLGPIAREHPGLYNLDLLRNRLLLGLQRWRAGRRAEAGDFMAEAEALLAMTTPARPVALFELACGYGLWSAEGGPGADARAAKAVEFLRRAVAGGYGERRRIEAEPALRGLRGRADFRLVLLDLDFPAEAFASGVAGGPKGRD